MIEPLTKEESLERERDEIQEKIKMIDYKGIVDYMVDNRSIKSGTSLEYNGDCYFIEIKLTKEKPPTFKLSGVKEEKE